MSDYTYSEIDPFMSNDTSGNISILYDSDAIIQWITVLLATISGECPRSNYGCGLIALLFQPMTQTTVMLMKQEIKTAIQDHIPPVTDVSVTVTPVYGKGYYKVQIDFQTSYSNISGSITTSINSLQEL